MCRPREDNQRLYFRNSRNLVHTNLESQRPWRLKPVHKSFIIWHVLAAAYYLSSSFCQCMKNDGGPALVDLSHTFDNTTIYWVTEPRLNLNVTFNGTLPGKDYWYQKDLISAATHGGTHMDAPCHFSKGKWCVSDIPLERLVVPAVVVNIKDYVRSNPNVHLTTDHLIEWEGFYGQIPKGSLLLIYTGWSQFWPDPLNYTGTSDRKLEELKFPSITGEAAKWIVSNRDIVGIGIDSMSVDVPNTGFPITHVTLYDENIYGLENVNNLHLLPPTGAMVYVMPMKLRDASGAPCRIVAQVPKGPFSAASTTFCSNLSYIVALVLCLVFSCNI